MLNKLKSDNNNNNSNNNNHYHHHHDNLKIALFEPLLFLGDYYKLA
jgi:hypothetical protein